MAGSNSGSFVPASTLLLLVAALGGALWYSEPLRSFRPPTGKPWTVPNTGKERVPARLWEDPFQAIRAYEPASGAVAAGEPIRSLNDLYGDATDALTVVAVMIPGGSRAESIETRLRTRYAIVAGLAEEGFLAVENDSIGYLSVGAVGKVPRKVPFEAYASAQRDSTAVVLWFDEGGAGGRPLAWVRTAIGPGSSPAVRILGPSSSNTLVQMMDEVAEAESGSAIGRAEDGPRPEEVPTRGDYTDWKVINFRATAPEPLLFAELRDNPHPEAETIRDWMARCDLDYRRVLCTDDALMLALAEELALRGVHPGDKTSVALVSELDTVYGRSLARALSGVLTLANGEAEDFFGSVDARAKLTRHLRDAPVGLHSAIIQVSYLRGLDGASSIHPGDTSASSDEGGDKQARWHQPVGPSQLDYLRRLSLSLRRRLDATGHPPRQPTSPRRLGAIGIVGTDVYDKGLALQALRPGFTDALFFTTDLDARLLHRSQYDWARNLVIASAFGLELAPAFQGRIPPFRDSYQTAGFIATRIAVGNTAFDGLVPPQPRIYEIGRNGAWDLTRIENDTLHPDTPAKGRTGPWREFPVFVLLLGVFWVMTSTTVGRLHSLWRDAQGMRGRLDATLIVLAVGFFVWLIVGLTWPEGSYGEPFALAEGISAWPTETLRGLTLLFCMLAMLFSIARLRTNAREIEKAFGVRRRKETSGSLAWSLGIEAHHEAVDINDLWNRYLANAVPKRTLLRVLCILAVYVVIAWMITNTLGAPFSPTRGWLADGADFWVFMLPSGLAFMALLLFAHDATRECSSLIHRLSGATTTWPRKSPVRERLGMHPDDVADILDVRFIASRTKAVGPLILAPFFALFLLVIARNHYFDNWDWPASLILMLSLQGLLALSAVLRMRQQAERARRIAVGSMRDRVTLLTGQGESSRASQVNQAIAQTEGLRTGAFGPWFQNPAVQALLMPFGGVGAIAIIDALVQSGVA